MSFTKERRKHKKAAVNINNRKHKKQKTQKTQKNTQKKKQKKQLLISITLLLSML